MEEEEKKETEEASETEAKTMSKKEFWIRFGIWFALAVLAPLGYIFFSYDIFVSAGSKKLSGWGIIAVCFACVMLMSIIHSAKKGMPNGSMPKQCLDGYTLLLPILFIILLIEITKDKIQSFEEFLIFMVICEAVAVPINPMPKWAAENNMKTISTVVGETVKKLFKK